MSKETNMALFNTFGFKGLELRDYFAAKAMQAYLTDRDLNWNKADCELAVKAAYILADAMLAERAKGEQ